MEPEKLPGSELPNNNPEKRESSEYDRARQDAIDEARNKEMKLAQMMEESEHDRETREMRDFMHQEENSEKQKEQSKRPEQQHLAEMFQEIPTDHINYPILQKLLPNFINQGEKQRLGKNIPVDAVYLVAGATESVLSIGKLASHAVIDAGRLIAHPIQSYRDTQEALESRVV